MSLDVDNLPVVIYTLPDDIQRLHLRRIDDHMILITTESPHMLERMHDRIIKMTILEDIIQHLKHTPEDIEIRFSLDSERNIEEGQIVEYRSNPIQIGVLSYVYKIAEHRLIIQSGFIK